MRSLWTGSIGFGLVNIPVSLYSASHDSGLDLDMLHSKDLSPIRYAKMCKKDGKELSADEIVKGFDLGEGDYVVITDEDFQRADRKKTSTIDIVSFTDLTAIDSVYFEKPYYLEPGKGAGKAYVLLREALRKSGQVGIARFVMRNKEHLALVKPEGRLLVLNQMRFHQEITNPEELKVPGDTEAPSSREIDMALALIDQLTEPFAPEQFEDTYTAELERVIREKAAGHVPKIDEEKTTAKPSNVKDLMGLLKASLSKDAAAEKPARKSAGKSKPEKSSPEKRHGTRKVSRQA